MKKLVIRRGSLDLAEVFPHQPIILIGRSPVCDVVLRVSGLKPVHFLMEWVGEGEFDAESDSGFWVVSSLKNQQSIQENQVAASVHAEAKMLKAEQTEYEGFLFCWVEDRLSRQDFERGMIRQQVLNDKVSLSSETNQVIELVRLSEDGQTLVDVEYLNKSTIAKSELLKKNPALSIKWSNAMPTLTWSDQKAKVTSLRGDRGPLSQHGSLDLENKDLIQFSNQAFNYFIRVVPQVRYPASESEIKKDPFYKWLAAFLVFAVLFIVVVATLVPENKEPEVVTEQRIARVEIKEAAPVEAPKAEPPPPPPAVEPAPPPEKVTAAPPKEMTKAHDQGRKSVAAAPSFKSAPGAPKAGLNSPAQRKNVNAVGLLGSMKKSGAGTPNTVSADRIINDGLVSDTVAGADAKVVVKQPPSGIVDLKKSQAHNTQGGEGGNDALMGASTTLTGGGTFDPKANGPIGRKGGMSGFTIGTGEGNEATGKVGPGGTGNSDFGESVLGGLDRETVRRAVMAHRREIRACYEHALIAKPKLKGKVVFKWYISPSGPVSSILLEDSELHHPQLEGCVMGVIKQIVFPKAPNGQPTTVIYPFMFQNS